ncbi:MAG: LysR family transcriptional regulator [Armatimonadota bacterium]
MELSQLRSFLQVAHQGSVTRAAEELCLTQPAVTRHIQALERECSARLFERTERGMRLTEAGAALRDYAQRSLALLDEAQIAVADLQRGVSGRLVLGAGVTTSIFRLPEWLRAFREQYPGVDVLVRTGRSREVARMALEREIDLGLVTSRVEYPELRLEALFDEEIVLVARREAAPERDLSPGDFGTLPLILFAPGTGFRGYVDQALRTAGLAARVKMESDSVEAVKSFVQVGLGASFLPAAVVEAELASGELRRLKVRGLPTLRRTTSLCHRTDRYLSAGARAFLEQLRERYGTGESAAPPR